MYYSDSNPLEKPTSARYRADVGDWLDAGIIFNFSFLKRNSYCIIRLIKTMHFAAIQVHIAAIDEVKMQHLSISDLVYTSDTLFYPFNCPSS